MAHGTRENAYKELTALMWEIQRLHVLPIEKMRKIAVMIKGAIDEHYNNQEEK